MEKSKNSSYYDNLRKKEWKSIQKIGPSNLTRYRIIIRLLKKFNFKGPLLDLGCGTGELLAKITKKTKIKKVMGSEFSGEAIKTARAYGYEVLKADITKINDFKNRKFNSIVCSEVLEHIKDDRLAISNLNKLLVKGGKAIITVPCGKRLWSSHDEFAGHVRRYELGELNKKFEKFRILYAFVWGGFFYSLYHSFITSINPKEVMKSEGSMGIIKKLAGKFFYYLFYLDDLFVLTNKGRRIFLVAEKR